MSNTPRLYAKVGRPTFEQLELIGMPIAQVTGGVISQKPTAFDLNGLLVFFQSEIVKRMVGDKELNSWPNYRGMRILRIRVGANPAETVGLPGPAMTPAERRIAGTTSPKTDDGERICWNYNAHIGCSDTGWDRARTFYKNYDALNTDVEIALEKRYGFKKRNNSPISKIGAAVSELRKSAQSEIGNRSGPPAARGGQNPQANPTLRAAGNHTPNPTDLRNIDYLDSGGVGKIRRHPYGTKRLFGSVTQQEEGDRAGLHERQIENDSDDPKFLETVNLAAQINSAPKLNFLMKSAPRISSYVKARVMHPLWE